MASVPVDPRFVGTWDLVAGPAHSEIVLAADGSYVHALWNDYRRHWGRWAVEVQDGHPFLALHLADAFPRQEFGPMGLQPVAWPAWEAWAITNVDAAVIILANATLVRQPDFVAPPAGYPPAPPLPPAGPPGFAEPAPASPPPTILQQWQNQAATFNQIRTIQAQINTQDMDTTRQISDMYAAQNTAMLKSQMAATQARSDVVHAGAEAFIASLRR